MAPKKKGSPLDGQVICISGTMSMARKEMFDAITAAGGTPVTTVTKATTILMTTDSEFAGVTSKVAKAKGMGLPIVKETWLDECLAKGKPMPTGPHEFGGGGGGAAAAPDPPKGKKRAAPADAPAAPAKAARGKKGGLPSAEPLLVATAKLGKVTVHQTGPGRWETWDAELIQQHPPNTDKYYKVQVVQSGSTYHCVQNWGRTGSSGQNNVDGPFTDADDAETVFKAKYKDKTGGKVWGVGDGWDSVSKVNKYLHIKPPWLDGKTEERGNWQYWIGDGVDGKRDGWYDYDAAALGNMEALWRTFQDNSWLGTRFVESGHFTYQIDLTSMTQMNTKTSKKRGIRRVAKGAKASNDPPPGF